MASLPPRQNRSTGVGRAAARAELQRAQQQFGAERERLQQQLAAESKRANDIAAWKRIESTRLQQHGAQQLQLEAERHRQELATRAARTATWYRKRNNLSRRAQRATAKAKREAERADISAAERQAMEADVSALSAEVGASHKKAPFAIGTVLRDLRVRQQSLNSGAGNVRPITGIYSSSIATDSRDLQLESGSLSTILRWKKLADVICMLLEGRRLRQALLTEPRTRIHALIDLSPDCRQIEQAGMCFEYATITYMGADGDAPPPFSTERLSGDPLSTNATVRFGVDGCPITIETWERVFAPMLAERSHERSDVAGGSRTIGQGRPS